jgi:hypothetical protein
LLRRRRARKQKNVGEEVRKYGSVDGALIAAREKPL